MSIRPATALSLAGVVVAGLVTAGAYQVLFVPSGDGPLGRAEAAPAIRAKVVAVAPPADRTAPTRRQAADPPPRRLLVPAPAVAGAGDPEVAGPDGEASELPPGPDLSAPGPAGASDRVTNDLGTSGVAGLDFVPAWPARPESPSPTTTLPATPDPSVSPTPDPSASPTTDPSVLPSPTTAPSPSPTDAASPAGDPGDASPAP